MEAGIVLAKIGRDAPEPMIVEPREFGPWFCMMAARAELSDEALAGLDVGFLNLLAALGLPGTENVNVDACVQTLNTWAQQVQAYTAGWWHLFVRSPEEYNHSAAEFRILALVTTLQKHVGVTYNMDFMEGDYDATDSRNLFIHGILTGNGGTCATMPVLYAAIGRRLGYPLKLVNAKEHLFVRWDEPGERFNIECTSPGFEPLDDEHFKHRPRPLTEAEIRSGYFLQNFRPREELATFLCNRAQCLMDNLRLSEALQSCSLAGGLAIENCGVRASWSIATVMARALEDARRRAGVESYHDLDLRNVPVPDGIEPFERWAAGVVREDLQRIAGIHASARARVCREVFADWAASTVEFAHPPTYRETDHVRPSVRTVHQ
jgi:hypothetical protein